MEQNHAEEIPPVPQEVAVAKPAKSPKITRKPPEFAPVIVLDSPPPKVRVFSRNGDVR